MQKATQKENGYCNGCEPGKDRHSMRLNGKRIVKSWRKKTNRRNGMQQNGALPEVFPVDCKRGLCIRGRSGTDSGCSWLDDRRNPAARYLIYGVGQQDKGLLSAGHGYLQIINQGSFQKPGIVYLLFFCNSFQPCRESDVCLNAFVIFFHAE